MSETATRLHRVQKERARLRKENKRLRELAQRILHELEISDCSCDKIATLRAALTR